MNRVRECRVWLVLLAATLLMRGAVLFVRGQALRDDPDAYRVIARGLVTDGVFGTWTEQGTRPSAYRPPLYPLLLAALHADGSFAPTWRVAALHLVLGTGTVALVFRLAGQLGLARGRWLAAGLTALDPLLLNQSTLVMTETLAAFLATLALVAYDGSLRRSSFAADFPAALSGMLAVLCRPTFLPWVIVLTGWLTWRRWQTSDALRERAAPAVAAIVAGLLLLGPWVVRNQRVMGAPIWSTTHGGYTLLLGNNPSFYRHIRSAPFGTVWPADEIATLVAEERRAADGDELPLDRRLYERARQFIRADRTGFMRACGVRLGRFWSPLPHRLPSDKSYARQVLRYAVATWYVTLFGAALAGAVVAWRTTRPLESPWLPGVLLCAAFTAAHVVYWSDLRMRTPLMPWLTVLAALGVWPIASVGPIGMSARTKILFWLAPAEVPMNDSFTAQP